jgi:cytochrome c biogenesis protein CcmG, thiol:disulfide interchange protein DsbE
MWASARASSAPPPRQCPASARPARLLLGATLLLALLPGASAAIAGEELLDLGSLKGRVVYVDFWASWCAPCRQSFPWMNRLQQELGPQGLVIVGVNVDRERGAAERFLKAHAARFHIVFDPDGVWPERFGVRGMPTSYLIDRDGRIRSRHEGFRVADRDARAQEIRALVRADPKTGGAN